MHHNCNQSFSLNFLALEIFTSETSLYFLQVPTTFQSVYGESLPKEFVTVFESPLMTIARTYPRNIQVPVKPNIFASFSQKINPKDILPSIVCSVGKGML